MALAALDPFANAASETPRTLGCLSLKPKQLQVVYWSVGLDVLAVLATGFVLRSPTGYVRLRQIRRSPINRAGFIDPHRHHKRPGCLCCAGRKMTSHYWDNVTKLHNYV